MGTLAIGECEHSVSRMYGERTPSAEHPRCTYHIHLIAVIAFVSGP